MEPRGLERVRDVTDAVTQSAVGEEREDVEAAGDVPEVVEHQVGLGQLPDLALLVGSDRFFRRAEIGALPGFDLDKDKGVAVISDDVDLASVEAESAADDSVLPFLEIGDRGLLTGHAEGPGFAHAGFFGTSTALLWLYCGRRRGLV